jgi:hypothetical protein
MWLLARKLNRLKWKIHKKLKVADVPGDAITICMRTDVNTLSVWQINSCEEEKMIDEGTLALVSSPEQQHLEAFDIVLLSPKELKRKNLEIIQKNERTLVADFEQAHWNISNLTYAKLGAMAKIILKKFCKKKVRRMSKMEITDIVIEALIQKRLEFDRLDKKIKKTVTNRCKARGVDTGSFVKIA